MTYNFPELNCCLCGKEKRISTITNYRVLSRTRALMPWKIVRANILLISVHKSVLNNFVMKKHQNGDIFIANGMQKLLMLF